MKYPHYRVVTDQITGENIELRIAFCDPLLMVNGNPDDVAVYKNTKLLEVLDKGSLMVKQCKEECFFELLKTLVKSLDEVNGKPRKLITVDFVAANRFDDHVLMVDAKAMDRVIVLVDQSDRWMYEKFDPVKWVTSDFVPGRVLSVRFMGGVGRRRAYFVPAESTRCTETLKKLHIESGMSYYFGFSAKMRNVKTIFGREIMAGLFDLIPNYSWLQKYKKNLAIKLVGHGHYWTDGGVQFKSPVYAEIKNNR